MIRAGCRGLSGKGEFSVRGSLAADEANSSSRPLEAKE